jgi:general secretion pathway protein K
MKTKHSIIAKIFRAFHAWSIKGREYCYSRPFFNSRAQSSESGIALILVLFIVTLASILVVNMTWTSSLDARENRSVERGLQSEYLLKSALNFARVLIVSDQNPEIDGKTDPWANGMLPLADGAPLPLEMLGLQRPGIRLSLEVRPADSKFPLQSIHVNTVLRDAAVRLFQSLGFDEDGEEDTSGLFPGKVFSSAELVANLIDYLDADRESYQSPDFPTANGIEGSLKEGTEFRNDGKLSRLGELSSVPGFTPARMQLLLPLTRAIGKQRMNVNFTPKVVLSALSDEMTPSLAEGIVAYREGPTPFGDQDSNLNAELANIIGPDAANDLAPLLDTDSQSFEVIAKVEDGGSNYFLRAFLAGARAGEPPSVFSMELY